jgi:FtsH-binding integral membrane protein
MKVRQFFAVGGLVAMVFGLAFLIGPQASLQMYGVETQPHNLMQARYFGSTLLAFGLILWLARNTRDEVAIRAMLIAGVLGNLVGALISLLAVMNRLQGPMAWGSVAIYTVFAVGGLYFLAADRHSAWGVT